MILTVKREFGSFGNYLRHSGIEGESLMVDPAVRIVDVLGQSHGMPAVTVFSATGLLHNKIHFRLIEIVYFDCCNRLIKTQHLSAVYIFEDK